jgi:hypothetical protein
MVQAPSAQRLGGPVASEPSRGASLVQRLVAGGYDRLFDHVDTLGGARRRPVAIWRAAAGRQLQNYRATFTILDAGMVPRAWIIDIMRGAPLSGACPCAFAVWAQPASRVVLPRLAGVQTRSSPCASRSWRRSCSRGRETTSRRTLGMLTLWLAGDPARPPQRQATPSRVIGHRPRSTPQGEDAPAPGAL